MKFVYTLFIVNILITFVQLKPQNINNYNQQPTIKWAFAHSYSWSIIPKQNIPNPNADQVLFAQQQAHQNALHQAQQNQIKHQQQEHYLHQSQQNPIKLTSEQNFPSITKDNSLQRFNQPYQSEDISAKKLDDQIVEQIAQLQAQPSRLANEQNQYRPYTNSNNLIASEAPKQINLDQSLLQQPITDNRFSYAVRSSGNGGNSIQEETHLGAQQSQRNTLIDSLNENTIQNIVARVVAESRSKNLNEQEIETIVRKIVAEESTKNRITPSSPLSTSVGVGYNPIMQPNIPSNSNSPIIAVANSRTSFSPFGPSGNNMAMAYTSV